MKSRSIRKVLVTGKAGLIGSAAVRQLMNEADARKGATPLRIYFVDVGRFRHKVGFKAIAIDEGQSGLADHDES